MVKFSRAALIAALVLTAALAGCKSEKPVEEQDEFSFVIYPNSKYLAQLTEMFKQAHKVLKPSEPEAPPTAIYETDASVDDVAKFYANSYGFPSIAPDATNNLSAAKPQAYYRTGDLASDAKAIEPLLQKMNLKTDITKASGSYKAVEINGKQNRPRVTVQRPYFDPTTSQTVDRTLILMAR